MTESGDRLLVEFESLIEDLVSVAVHGSSGDERVDQVFIFAGLGDLKVFSAYYRIGDEISTLTSVNKALGYPERTIPELERIQFSGLGYATDISHLFQASDQENPSELRIVYNCAPGTLDYALYYNPPKIGSSQTSSRLWLESLRKGEDPLPDEAS